MLNKKNIFIIGAHPDDEIFGAGGTIAKYSSQGKKVFSIIMSYGEASHPWLKRKIIVKTRVKEALKAERMVGVYKSFFFGLKEGSFDISAKRRDVRERLKTLIEKFKPYMILTHSVDDWHPDHVATVKLVLDVYPMLKQSVNPQIYCFDNIWSPISFKKSNYAKLFVDITPFFNKKLKALKCFKSQKSTMISLYWSVYVRAFLNGLKIRKRYAEIFYRIK